MTRRSFRVSFEGGSGHPLAGIVDQHAGDGSHPVAVFSHCFTCNKDLKAIVRISRALREMGITVLRYDMTGLGGSGGDFSQTNFSTQLEDLRAAIEFAKSELGEVTALIGHSFGGAASLAAASTFASKDIKALVTLAAPSDTQHLATLLGRMSPEIEDQGIGKVSIGGLEWTIRRQMLDDFRSHQLPELIPHISAATMLVHSPSDQTVGYDHALRIMGLMQSSAQNAPCSLLTLDGADHLLAENPADLVFVAESIAAFVRRFSI